MRLPSNRATRRDALKSCTDGTEGERPRRAPGGESSAHSPQLQPSTSRVAGERIRRPGGPIRRRERQLGLLASATESPQAVTCNESSSTTFMSYDGQ